MEALIDLFLHFDAHLAQFVQTYGVWVYALLFLIIFAETGLVVTPFLPGDSLLFAAGALAASSGAFNMWILVPLLIVAAVLGDAVNYAVGRRRRPTGLHGRRSHQLLASAPQSRPPGQGARVLREVRRQGHRPRPLRADRADVRAVRRRRRHDDLRAPSRSTT